jgi:hypothetical protein
MKVNEWKSFLWEMYVRRRRNHNTKDTTNARVSASAKAVVIGCG